MSLGIWQILLLVVLVMLLFGAGRLPRIMGDVAKGIKSFKKGLDEEVDTIEAKVVHEDTSKEKSKDA